MSATFDNSARAQNLVTTEPIVVSASRMPTPLAETPGSITVIPREQIEAREPISTIDLLRQIPGLHIDQPGGRGSVSSVYIRGSDPNFTLVLIDGVKVNDPTNSRGGSFDFSTLDVGSVERVEIVSGPLSSVYGSDAMGGVINIVTRQGTAEPEFSVEAEGGRHGYYRTAFEARGPLGTGDYALNAAYVDNGSPVEGSAFISKSFNASVNIPPSDTTWLRLVSRYADSNSKTFPDDSGGPDFAVLRDVDERDMQELTAAAEFGHEIFPGWEYSLKASYYDRQEDISSPGVAPGVRDPAGIPPNSSDNSFRRTNLVVSSLISLAEALRVTVGFDAQFEEGSSDSVLFFGSVPVPSRFELDRTVYAPFLEAQYSWPIGLMIQGGLRIDYPDDFDSEVSPRVGALYRIKSIQTTIKANWGEGFKLPSFFALGDPIVGNPDLRPETSESFDLGVVQDLWAKRANISATIFHSRFFNVVDLDEGPPPRLVNRSEVTAKGIELGLDVQPTDNLWINAHLTYTETDIKGTDEELRNRPEWRGGINARWRPKTDLVLNLGILYIGDVFDSSIATGDRTLDDYLRVDVAATWTPVPNWRISVAVDNLFNTDYEEAVGFPAPGITPRIVARLTF
ncbi:MAG: TonB-dependent receptor [Candidatus Methylomirabilales bacterium]